MKISVEVHHYLHPEAPDLAALLNQMKGEIMSALSDKIASLTTSVDAALGRVQTDLTTLMARIAELEALVAAGGATPEDLAALESLRAKLDALDPAKPDTLPTETV